MTAGITVLVVDTDTDTDTDTHDLITVTYAHNPAGRNRPIEMRAEPRF